MISLCQHHHILAAAALLITTSTSPASTTDTLNGLILFELSLRNAANASGVEIRFFGLDAAEAAKLEND